VTENFFNGFDAAELRTHFFRRNDDGSSRRESALTFPGFSEEIGRLTSAATSDNNRNPRFNGDSIQGKIASNPACPACVDESGGRLMMAEAGRRSWGRAGGFSPATSPIHIA